MSRINETRQMVLDETCKWVCILTKAVCNTKQIWNKDTCKCECKEDLINKLTCDKGYMWNPSTCECKYDKLCDVGQYLDYKNCVCRKRLINNLVKQCINIVDEDIMRNEKMISTPDCPSHTPYIVLLVLFLLVSLIICGVVIYFRWYKAKKEVPNVSYLMAGIVTY